MNKLFILTAAALMAVSSLFAQAPVEGQFVVVGHNNKNVSIIDVASNKIVWQLPLLDKEQSNSVTMLEGGRLMAYTTQLGCKVVNLDKELLFEYTASSPRNSEVHSVVPMRGGGFAVFESGTPARIVVFSKTFAKVNEITFDGGSTNKHNQFRQALYSKSGTWIIPCFESKEVREYDKEGFLIETYDVGEKVFGIKDRGSNLYLGMGDGHEFGVFNTKRKEFTKKFNSLKGMEFNFVYNAQFQPIDKEFFAAANWTGHRTFEKTLPEPQIVIFDANDTVVWAWNDEGQDLGKVSGFFYSKKPIIK